MATGHARPRTRSSVTIWHLPTELLVHIFSGVHIRDLLSLVKVSRSFQQLVNTNSPLWTHASFSGSWPSTEASFQIFNRAADQNNFEALIKLALAKLYNEGLPDEPTKTSIKEKAKQAMQHFCLAEEITSASPFTWIFIRPPWAPSGTSCKFFVFEAMKEQLDQGKFERSAGTVAANVAYVLHMRDQKSEADHYFELAGNQGIPEAQLMLWLGKLKKSISLSEPLEAGNELELMRQLRRIAAKHDCHTKLVLCANYVTGKLGGISLQQAFAFSSEVFQSSTPVNILPMLSPQHQLNASARYILVDWLVEVTTMKDFSSKIMHNAVTMVDHCIRKRDFGRDQLQLLGVSAMVISSRCVSKDIITIREAAWLTDNTYTYEDVVKMVGEIMATLRGHIKFTTSYDFAQVMSQICPFDAKGRSMMDYMTELCMLQASLTKYSPAEIAASCVLLARVLSGAEEIWPRKMEMATGFFVQDLTRCTFDIHEKCLLEGTRFDSQNFPMEAVKGRYDDDDACLFKMEETKISRKDLKEKLGVKDPVMQAARSRLRLRKAEKLICSPSRGKRTSRRRSSTLERPSRDEASTPPLDREQPYDADCEEDTDPFDLNDSFCSWRSEDDSEPRTEVYSEAASDFFSEPFSEPASEPFSEPPSELFSEPASDSALELSCKVSTYSNSSYVVECAQTSTSPSALQIRTSGCFWSSNTSSSSGCTTVQLNGFSSPESSSHHPIPATEKMRSMEEEDEDDRVSLGFAVTDEFLADDEAEDERANEPNWGLPEECERKNAIVSPVILSFMGKVLLLDSRKQRQDYCELQREVCEPGLGFSKPYSRCDYVPKMGVVSSKWLSDISLASSFSKMYDLSDDLVLMQNNPSIPDLVECPDGTVRPVIGTLRPKRSAAFVRKYLVSGEKGIAEDAEDDGLVMPKVHISSKGIVNSDRSNAREATQNYPVVIEDFNVLDNLVSIIVQKQDDQDKYSAQSSSLDDLIHFEVLAAAAFPHPIKCGGEPFPDWFVSVIQKINSAILKDMPSARAVQPTLLKEGGREINMPDRRSFVSPGKRKYQSGDSLGYPVREFVPSGEDSTEPFGDNPNAGWTDSYIRSQVTFPVAVQTKRSRRHSLCSDKN